MTNSITNPLKAFKQRADERSRQLVRCWSNPDVYRIAVEGMGDWGRNNYLPAIRNARSSGLNLSAQYRDVVQTMGDVALEHWESFELKADPWEPIQDLQDLLVVTTPDTTHVDILEASAGRFNSAIVEKPFCVDQESLCRAKASVVSGASLWGVDHYPFYIAEAVASAEEIWRHLDGKCKRVEFALMQTHPIESERLPSLGMGLGCDMLSHFFAMLVALGLVGEVQQMQVRSAAQHELPAGVNYAGETCLDLQFQIDNPNGSGEIECRAIAGKGMPVDVKYLDLIGANGAAVRFDMGSNAWGREGYRRDCIIFLTPSNSRPLNHAEYLGSSTASMNSIIGSGLDTKRPYSKILEQLIIGRVDSKIASCLFTVKECDWIVTTLELMRKRLRDFLGMHGGKWPAHTPGKFPHKWNPNVWD